MNRRAFIVSIVLMAFSVSLPVYAQKKRQADRSDPFATTEKEPLILKFYPLGELVSPIPQLPYNPTLPTAAVNSVRQSQNFGGSYGGGGMGGGGMGGGGMGGGQGGGGQGFFSVPASAQFGGGGGGFGGGGAVNFGVTQHQVVDSHDVHESLINLITDHIDPDSWEDNGGKGTVSAVNSTLLIRQTKGNHAAIAAFLKDFAATTVGGQPLSIELWWLPLNAGARRNVRKALEEGDTVTALNDLCESVGGYHGTLQARNRATASLASGHRMPLITGRIPVVGSAGNPGYQPVVTHVNIGIMAEVTPQLQEDWQGDGVRLTLRTAMTTMTDHTEAGANNGDIDRFQLGSQTLETNAICAFEAPTVAGSLSAVGLFPEDDDEDRELVVVVLVTR